MTFYIDNLSQSRDIVSLKDIKVNGYFSVDSKREVMFDSSNMCYLSRLPVKPPLDCEKGIETNETSPETGAARTDEHIDSLLRWIMKNENKIRATPSMGRSLRPNFICTRGALSRFLRAPFQPKEEWIMCAGKWKGSIYLTDFDTEAHKLLMKNCSDLHKRSWYWGNKFEQYMLTDDPNKPSDTSKPVNGDVEFHCVFEARLGNYHLLYSAEMDGIRSEKKLEDPLPLDELKFIELKTCKMMREAFYFKTFKRYKSLQWWCQTYPVKTQDILCGFRDDNGVVRELKYYRVAELADDAKRDGMWSSTKAMNFLNDFFKLIENTVVDDCTKTIYKFEKTPYNSIKMTQVSASSEYGVFMRDWYMES